MSVQVLWTLLYLFRFVNLTLSVQVLWTWLFLFRFCEPYFICSGSVNLTLSVRVLRTFSYLICSGFVNLTLSVQVLWTLVYLFRFCEPYFTCSGFVNLVGWLFWCRHHWTQLPHTRKCLAVMVGMNLLLLLEVLDFPPLGWTFDAHSLWHAGTVPLGFLWYRSVLYKKKSIAN